MLVCRLYQLDLGSIYYYAPLNFSVKTSEVNVLNPITLSFDEVLPEIILQQLNNVEFSCQINKNIIPRKLVIQGIDNNEYTCVNPIRPYTEDFFTLIEQLKNSDKINSFRLWGETLKAFYLPIVLEKNA